MHSYALNNNNIQIVIKFLLSKFHITFLNFIHTYIRGQFNKFVIFSMEYVIEANNFYFLI